MPRKLPVRRERAEVVDAIAVELADALGGDTDELPVELRLELADLLDAAERYAAAAEAPNTVRAYASDWQQFQDWCARYDLRSLPATPAACALFLTSLSRRGLQASTVRRRAAAIARAHRQAGYLPPTQDARVLTVLEGIARVHGQAPAKKVALLRDPLLELVGRIDASTAAGLRDRALLLLGFAVGLRRSELVALNVADLSPSPDGLRIRIARSKTDQRAAGHDLLVLYAQSPRPCAVRAVRAWLDHARIIDGPIFRRVTRTQTIGAPLSAQSVALIIKKRATAAGLDPKDFAGHSLRSGYATQAARDGHHDIQIADVTRHKDQRVLAGYIRAGQEPDTVARVL